MSELFRYRLEDQAIKTRIEIAKGKVGFLLSDVYYFDMQNSEPYLYKFVEERAEQYGSPESYKCGAAFSYKILSPEIPKQRYGRKLPWIVEEDLVILGFDRSVDVQSWYFGWEIEVGDLIEYAIQRSNFIRPDIYSGFRDVGEAIVSKLEDRKFLREHKLMKTYTYHS